MSANDFTDVSQTDVEEEVKLSKLKEKIFLLNSPPETGRVLVLKNNPQDLLGFEYNPKSGSFHLNINNYLRDLGLIPQDYTLPNDKLVCIFDKVIDNTVYRVFLINKLFTDLPETVELGKIKKLTNANSPNHKVYLDLFLKIFSNLELTSLFKT